MSLTTHPALQSEYRTLTGRNEFSFNVSGTSNGGEHRFTPNFVQLVTVKDGASRDYEMMTTLCGESL